MKRMEKKKKSDWFEKNAWFIVILSFALMAAGGAFLLLLQ